MILTINGIRMAAGAAVLSLAALSADLTPATAASRADDPSASLYAASLSFSRSKPAIKETRSTNSLEALIVKHAHANGISPALALAVITVESNFNPRARSRAGEVGLMQIKPRTARGMGFSGSTAALYNPDTNLRWGMKYLGEAQRLSGGNLCGTILRYNAGHYARRMNPISARYCSKVRSIIGSAETRIVAMETSSPARPGIMEPLGPGADMR